jgi:two-component system, response regulator PdtaR
MPMLRRSGILIVEDEPIIRLELVTILRGAGFEVIGDAGTRRVALAIAEKSPPEVALLDINLYGVWDGFTIAGDLSSLYGTKIVFMTSYQTGDVIERARAFQPAAIVHKPASESHVVAGVRHALNRARASATHPEGDSQARQESHILVLGNALPA